jgi:hypothetical protein
MSTPGQAPSMPQGPGFITVILDIPFSLARGVAYIFPRHTYHGADFI